MEGFRRPLHFMRVGTALPLRYRLQCKVADLLELYDESFLTKETGPERENVDLGGGHCYLLRA